MAYFSNGTAGMALEEQCARCPWGQEPCEVALVHYEFNYDQVDKGQEKLRQALSILVTDDGTCQIFERVRKLQGLRFPPDLPPMEFLEWFCDREDDNWKEDIHGAWDLSGMRVFTNGHLVAIDRRVAPPADRVAPAKLREAMQKMEARELGTVSVNRMAGWAGPAPSGRYSDLIAYDDEEFIGHAFDRVFDRRYLHLVTRFAKPAETVRVLVVAQATGDLHGMEPIRFEPMSGNEWAIVVMPRTSTNVGTYGPPLVLDEAMS